MMYYMTSGDQKWEKLKQAAYELFDGDKEKGEKLLLLIQTMTSKELPVPPEFQNLKMKLPEESCRWCYDGECICHMPDSLFLCEGKCSQYEERITENKGE